MFKLITSSPKESEKTWVELNLRRVSNAVLLKSPEVIVCVYVAGCVTNKIYIEVHSFLFIFTCRQFYNLKFLNM